MTTADAPALCANPNRKLEIDLPGGRYLRLPVKTPRFDRETDLAGAVRQYALPHAAPGDVLFISEKAVAVTQGRAIPVSEIRVGLTARLLWKCVAKVPYGIGLRSPTSMQCAVDECGAPRIWLAAIAGALGKAVGRRGDFYRIAGPGAATIDAAGTSPLQTDCVILGPRDPAGAARHIHRATGLPCAIVDVNDIGGSWVLGASDGVDKALVEAALRDNPLGQGEELTPMGLLRREG